MHLSPKNRRRGLTLLEVIVSLAVFLMAITGLMFLLVSSTQWAAQAQARSQATLYAQSLLNEVRIGSAPPQSTSEAPLEDDKDFNWSMTAEAGPYEGLINVTVRVSRRTSGGNVEVALSQMVLDPAFQGSSLDGAGSSSQSESGMSSSTPSTGTTPDTGTPPGGGGGTPSSPTGPRIGGGTGGSLGGGGGTPGRSGGRP